MIPTKPGLQPCLLAFSVGKAFLIFNLLVMLAFSSNAMANTKQLLILHDSSGPFGYLGKEYAIMLRNLLGHFDANVTILPAKSYTSGTIDQKDATFYIGSTYDEPSFLTAGSQQRLNYDAFIRDAATTTKTVAWINYNLFKIAWEWDPAWGANTFYEKMGYFFHGTKNDNFNRVKYKNVELHKGVISWVNPGSNLTGCFAEGGGAQACASELNAIVITDPTKVQIKATAYSTLNLSAPEEPYISRSGNFWYIGDMPFSYISEEDRYLAFADILHDIVGSGIGQQPLKAIVRFEDVSAGVDPVSLEAVMSYLESESVPFAVAAIPIYKDPQGVQSGGTPTTIKLANSDIANIIRPFYQKGLVSMIAHGYTHQSGNLDNPYNALSGDDFEFYRVTLNSDFSLNYLGGVPGDSRQWAKDRMTNSKQELSSANFEAFAWEAPHYFATEADYLGIKDVYSTHYGRMIYTSNESPAGRFIGQFYPYVIRSDYYGYRQIPENLGNIEPEPFLGYRPLFAADLIRHAEKIKVVRDSVASFFYHPFLGEGYLSEVVQGLKGLGYQFIAPCSLGDSCPTPPEVELCDINSSVLNLTPGNWQQISLPCTPPSDAATVQDVFGDDLNGNYGSDWVVFSYDPSSNAYTNVGLNGTLTPGVGYWITHSNGSTATLDLPSGSTQTAATLSNQCTSSNGCYSLPLISNSNQVLWNMSGHPFSNSIAADRIRVVTNSGPCASGCTLNQAKTENIVENTLWHFGNGSYQSIQDSNPLHPWDGFWIAVLAGSAGLEPTLEIPEN